MLRMVHLRMQVVHGDHFQEVSSEQPSDGPIVITEPLEHANCHFGGYWPTSICEVHFWPRLVHGRQGPCVGAASCQACVNCESRIP